MYARKRIYHGCLVRIEKSVPRDHCLASLGTASWCQTVTLGRFFYPHLTLMKDSYILHNSLFIWSKFRNDTPPTFVYRFNGVGATSRCPECVVETISQWHNFAVVPGMITTREDGDSINHISLAFEIGAKIKIALTSVRSLNRKYLLETSSLIYLCKNHS